MNLVDATLKPTSAAALELSRFFDLFQIQNPAIEFASGILAGAAIWM
ncbi:MAG TPA: hypothetical protein VEU96_02465 [Bryobacteraceae bacterium]|nr:hypothetical protein [Bryobacteraceae bacterium]